MIPAIMVILQPDLGTGMLLIFIFSMMIFYKRLRWKTIATLGVISILSGVLMYNFGLREYQRKRILTFIDPYQDAKGSGYNAIQSEIAIGSGRLFGKGFKNSSQASLNYLPENHTDFVFAIFNEEHGFFGSVFLIILYLVFFMRMIWLASSVQRFYDSVLVIGVMSIFFWHAFINMAMVSGLLPIVGIPLPLMSYGGSSMLTFGVGVGMATSISNSRNFFN
jgi:rod shape determining protein RodA